MAQEPKNAPTSNDVTENEKGSKNKGRTGTASRGFASMDPEQQRKIARKGGEAVSGNRQHMAAIGRKGGEASGAGRRALTNKD